MTKPIYDKLYYDEVSTITEDQWRYLIERARLPKGSIGLIQWSPFAEFSRQRDVGMGWRQYFRRGGCE